MRVGCFQQVFRGAMEANEGRISSRLNEGRISSTSAA